MQNGMTVLNRKDFEDGKENQERAKLLILLLFPLFSTT